MSGSSFGYGQMSGRNSGGGQMICIKDLWFSYKQEDKKYALQEINLEIDNRTTAIIGQNGAGKTTFAKILKGLMLPTQGTITVLGEDITKTTVAKLAAKIGLVFQNPNDQIFKKFVLEEALFGPLNIGMEKEVAEKNVLQALEIVGLDDKKSENPHDLTLSEKKLLCIASVLAMDTDIIILDEPTMAQDYVGKEKIKDIIRLLQGQGKLVMTIIHDMDFVAECFERTIVFNEGKVLLDGNTADVFAGNEVLAMAHVAPPHVQQLALALGMKETCLTGEDFVRRYQGSL